MKHTSAIFFGAAILLCLSGCSRESDAPIASRITIAPLITRVAGLNFEIGDQIGLTVTRTSETYVNNEMLAYDAGQFSSSTLKWYDGSDGSTLTAYYPYSASGRPATFRVSADQSAGNEASDLLVAVKSGVAPTSETVNMLFRHLMTKINIVVTNSTANTVSELSVSGTVLSAAIDYEAQTATATQGQTASAIKAYAVTSGTLYNVVTVPQSAALTITVTLSNGKTLSTKFAQNTFLSGKSYTAEVAIVKDQLIPKLSGEITDWVPGGSLTPNQNGGGNSGESGGGEAPDPAPGDNTMVCQGVTYKTATIGSVVWMTENLRHIPTGGVSAASGTWYVNDDSSTINDFGLLYTQASALLYCPAGWRIPTDADFTQLIAQITMPYNDFLPLAGIYDATRNTMSNFTAKGCMVGATASDEEMAKYLINDRGMQLMISERYSIVNGASVRYVKDVQ